MALRYFYLALLPLLAWACSTDVDVNAPRQERALVYALLDPALPYQVVRLERGFLNAAGESAYQTAKNPDSLQYRPEAIEVRFSRVSGSGADIESRILADTVVGKDTGIFFSPTQIAYRTSDFRLDNSDKNRQYRIRVTDRRTGYTASATTTLVGSMDNASIFKPVEVTDQDGTKKRVLYAESPDLAFKGPANAQVFQAKVIVPITETLQDLTHREDTLEYLLLPELIIPEGSIGQRVNAPQPAPNDFFEMLRQNLDTSGVVTQRRFQPVTISITYGNSLLANYLLINSNFSVLTQSKPTYSNVANGLGLVASRSSHSFTAEINRSAIQIMFDSPRYRKLNFR